MIMKTKEFITGILSILIMFWFSLSFMGCNNDDDGDGGDPITVAYRVTEKVSTQVSGSYMYEDKSVYSYLDNLLIEAIRLYKEEGTWLENEKRVFEYQGDWVTSRGYYKDGDNWVEQGMQGLEEMKIVNGKIMEIKYTYPNGIYRQVFTYNGDKIIKIESFDNDELEYKYVCTYIGENIDEIVEYEYNDGVEELDYKYEFSYVNGNLSEVLALNYYNGVWEISDKDVYTYSGNKVIQIDDYDYYNDTWELDDSEYFSYNSLGLLESISESGEGWTWEEIYTYEEGIGNYRLLYGDAGYYDVFNYPNAQRMTETVASPDDRKINVKRLLIH